MLQVFVMEGAEHLQRVASEQRQLLGLLKNVATRVLFIGKPRYRAFKLIAESPAPIEMRRSCALEIVRDSRNSTQISTTIVQLLDASSFPALREMVRKSPDADHFHYSASSALAYHGDREIVPDLEAWRSKLRARSHNFEGYVKGYIWKIGVQHPSSKLIDYIVSAEDREHRGRRTWAANRAVALGLPKADIRDAILKYAESVTDVGKHGYRVGLSGLKNAGLRLGVLLEGDLPDVIVLPTRPEKEVWRSVGSPP